jgi:hypothetical protein
MKSFLVEPDLRFRVDWKTRVERPKRLYDAFVRHLVAVLEH